MIQLCFDRFVYGALRRAQGCRGGGQWSSVFVYSGSAASPDCDAWPPEIPQHQPAENAIPLGGTPGDVICLNLALHLGDIAAPLQEHGPRWSLLHDAAEGGDSGWDGELDAIETLLRRAGDGEAVRIWYENLHHSICGLHFAAELLQDLDCPVTALRPPEWRQRPDGSYESVVGWGTFSPEEYGQFLGCETRLSPALLSHLAAQWAEYKKENAPLRVVIGGRLVSVSSDFYDPIIRRSIPRDSFKLADLILDLMRRTPGLTDSLIHLRVKTMIAAGELRVVEENAQNPYRALLCANRSE